MVWYWSDFVSNKRISSECNHISLLPTRGYPRMRSETGMIAIRKCQLSLRLFGHMVRFSALGSAYRIRFSLPFWLLLTVLGSAYRFGFCLPRWLLLTVLGSAYHVGFCLPCWALLTVFPSMNVWLR